MQNSGYSFRRFAGFCRLRSSRSNALRARDQVRMINTALFA